MPSHSERVRRNYVDVRGAVYEAPRTNEWLVTLRVSRAEVASQARGRDVLRLVDAFLNQFRWEVRRAFDRR